MKKQNTSEMVSHVRAILEQNQNPADLVASNDAKTLSIEQIIANVLEEAVAMAVVNADDSLFEQVEKVDYLPTDEAYEVRVVKRLVEGEGWYDASNNLKTGSVTKSTETHYYKQDGTEVNYAQVTQKTVAGTTEVYYEDQQGNILYTRNVDNYSIGGVAVTKRKMSIEIPEEKSVLKEGVLELVDGTNIVLPDGLLRFLSIKADTWNGIVKELYGMNTPLYRMCQNKYVKSVGVKDRPVAFKGWDAGTRQISIYPAASDKVSISYVKRPTIGDDQTIECDNLLYEGACFYAAYLVAMVQGWANANGYKAEAVQALNVEAPVMAGAQAGSADV